MEFIQKFAPKEAENLPLWQHISFQAFPAELRKQTAHDVVRIGAAQSRRWLSGSRTVGELEWLASNQFDWFDFSVMVGEHRFRNGWVVIRWTSLALRLETSEIFRFLHPAKGFGKHPVLNDVNYKLYGGWVSEAQDILNIVKHIMKFLYLQYFCWHSSRIFCLTGYNPYIMHTYWAFMYLSV